jgi:hypothetical protein
VRTAGGQVLEGPTDIPSGRVARCTDPQGAVFALIGQRGQKTMGYFSALRDPADRGRRWSW